MTTAPMTRAARRALQRRGIADAYNMDDDPDLGQPHRAPDPYRRMLCAFVAQAKADAEASDPALRRHAQAWWLASVGRWLPAPFVCGVVGIDYEAARAALVRHWTAARLLMPLDVRAADALWGKGALYDLPPGRRATGYVQRGRMQRDWTLAIERPSDEARRTRPVAELVSWQAVVRRDYLRALG